MNINFTKNEYRLLLDLVYLAEWMLAAYATESTPEGEQYDMVIQKIFAHAKEMGCEALIDASVELGGYYPTREYEEHSGMIERIETYNAETGGFDFHWEDDFSGTLDEGRWLKSDNWTFDGNSTTFWATQTYAENGNLVLKMDYPAHGPASDETPEEAKLRVEADRTAKVQGQIDRANSESSGLPWVTEEEPAE